MLAASVIVATCHLLAADRPARPNIVFLFADDLGIDGISCYGSDRFKGKTPNIDALAKGGIRFERAYSTPLCGPSRCQIMTGRYGFRTGGFSNPAAHNPASKDEPSLAKTLKQAGYVTGMAGKWRQMGESPGDWGFDEFITDNTASGWYWQTNYNKNGKPVSEPKEIYYPDVCLDFAKDFFRRHRDEPFYFYYPTHLVHGPILRTPDTKPGTTNREALYDDNVAYLDKQVGQIVAELDKLGLREKTLILFSIDNGTAQRSFTIGGRQINGRKGTMMEGGARVPLIANWKGVTPFGKVLNDLVDFSDFFPTFAELAGAKMPSGFKFDGHSFAPQLRGQKGQPREWVFVQLGAYWYVRNDGWKLNESGELFDMTDAPFVEKLVYGYSEDDKAKAARQKLRAVLNELNPAGGKTAPPGDDGKMPKKQRKKKKAAAKA
jgi:arylsulfatase A-like enzyme